MNTFLELGQQVSVTPDGAYTFHEFQGMIVGFDGESVIVRDMDGQCFDCGRWQVTPIVAE